MIVGNRGSLSRPFWRTKDHSTNLALEFGNAKWSFIPESGNSSMQQHMRSWRERSSPSLLQMIIAYYRKARFAQIKSWNSGPFSHGPGSYSRQKLNETGEEPGPWDRRWSYCFQERFQHRHQPPIISYRYQSRASAYWIWSSGHGKRLVAQTGEDYDELARDLWVPWLSSTQVSYVFVLGCLLLNLTSVASWTFPDGYRGLPGCDGTNTILNGRPIAECKW